MIVEKSIPNSMNYVNLTLSMLLLLISMTSLANEPYAQIRFPLDNGKGVPFAMAEGDWAVEGFDVDGQGHFYFLGGMTTLILAALMKADCCIPGKWLCMGRFIG